MAEKYQTQFDARRVGLVLLRLGLKRRTSILGMSIEGKISRIEAHGIYVIQHQSYPDAPVSSCEDFPGKQFAGYITLPVIVLKIQTASGLAGKIKPDAESLQVITNTRMPV